MIELGHDPPSFSIKANIVLSYVVAHIPLMYTQENQRMMQYDFKIVREMKVHRKDPCELESSLAGSNGFGSRV